MIARGFKPGIANSHNEIIFSENVSFFKRNCVPLLLMCSVACSNQFLDPSAEVNTMSLLELNSDDEDTVAPSGEQRVS